MKMTLSCLALVAAGLIFPQWSPAQGYGHLTGQFVLDGNMPNIAALKLGDKDKGVCAVNPPLPEERLIVDPKTKGIANIVVYLKKAPKTIHPNLKASKEKQIVFDQKNCRFTPHVLLARTDQEILVKSCRQMFGRGRKSEGWVARRATSAWLASFERQSEGILTTPVASKALFRNRTSKWLHG
jgi:hypothetical protein